MGIYRVPPSPVIGGRQPLESRKLPPSELAVAVNDPPFGQRIWLSDILRMWQPRPPVPWLPGKLNPSLEAVVEDQPPFGQRLWMSGVLAMWHPGPPRPRMSLRVVPPPSVEGAADGHDKITLGTEESTGITLDPTLGGWWGH